MTDTPETPKPAKTPKKAKAATPEKSDAIHPLAKPFLWLDSHWARKAPFWIFLIAALGLLAWEYVHPRHGYLHVEELFGFYEIMGFFGFCLAVLAGWPLRKLLWRPEDYYDRESSDD